MKLATAISMRPFVVLCLTETWLVGNVKGAELYLDNFKIFRSERTSNVLRGSTCSIRNTNYHVRFF